ncbi:MAG: CAP domain-containing protein [Anaerolineae bacterium]|nr:CAP domain-containing protein [Anaerolineae bacterium]
MIWCVKKDGKRWLMAVVSMLGAVFSVLGCYIAALPTVDRPTASIDAITRTVSPTRLVPTSTQTRLVTLTVVVWATSTAPPLLMPTMAPLATWTMMPTVTPTVVPSPIVEKTGLPQLTATALQLTATLPEGGVEAWPQEVFRLINAVRAEHDLPSFIYNDRLAHVAQLHGQDCLERGSLTHTGSDGSDVKARILRSGYDAIGWAEVITYSASPQEAVTWWIDEVPPNDAHRRTLLGSWLTEIGVAVIPLGNGTYYFITDLARPASP